jgi:uncharacterized membrane protein YbhN (UPF0104 family)
MKYFTNIHKNKTYNLVIRLAIIFATYYFIYKQIFHKRRLDFVVESFSELVSNPHFTILIIWTFLLMIVNWGIESLKWQYLINKVESLSFLKSFQAVLSGVSVSLFTPNRVGEWFGRVFMMKKANPWKGVFITIIGSFSQLLITLIIGSISFVFFVPIYLGEYNFYSNYLLYGLIMLVAVIVATLVLIFLNITAAPSIIQRFIKKRFVHFNDYISVISSYSSTELLTVLLLSFLRYLVFSLQFYILLMMFSVEIPLFHGLMIITMVFFIMTAIPTVTLAELGVRGSVSLFFIGLYFETFSELTDKINIGIISSASLLWLINLAIPAIAGTIFVSRLNFFRKKQR